MRWFSDGIYRFCVVGSSKKDPRLYLVYSHDSHALSQSFDELQLFDEHSSDLVSVSNWLCLIFFLVGLITVKYFEVHLKYQLTCLKIIVTCFKSLSAIICG